MYCKLIALLCLGYVIASSHGARILGIMPTPSYSHQIVFIPLWKELSLRGHQVTVLTTDPIKDPTLTNLTEIDLHFAYDIWSKGVATIVTKQRDGLFSSLTTSIMVMHNTSVAILNHPEVQALIKNQTEHFDLVLAELMIPIMFEFAHRFKCPAIGLATRDVFQYNYHNMGNPSHPIVNPDIYLPFNEDLSFKERLYSMFLILYAKLMGGRTMPALQRAVVDEVFGVDYPAVKDLEKQLSMMFVYAEPILHRVRPLVPTVIQIGGGMHFRPPKPLPTDIQKTLDAAKNGVIYFSLGTNAKSKDLPLETRQMLLEALAELPYTVLWKFESEMENVPDNVRISKWYPQQDVLNHTNVKLFITQGGIQSIEEAVHFHVPMVGIPIFGVQHSNIHRLVSKGIAVFLDVKKLDKKSFQTAILEVMNNPMYLKNIKEVARQVRDQPMTGLEKSVWWTEYVLRHNGTKHLRSPMLDIPDYQYFLLDVIGFVLFILILATYLIFKILKLFVRLVKCFVKSKPKQKVQ